MVRRSYRTTTHRNGGLLSRLRGRRQQTTTTTTTTTKTTSTGRNPAQAVPHSQIHSNQVRHNHRRPTIGDKISGAFMKLEGSLTRRPGLKVSISATHLSDQKTNNRFKAAGTRRMRGTDGRYTHGVY